MAYPRLTEQPTALELAALIRTGERSVAEVVDHAIARIERDDARLDAVVVTDFERARERARSLDAEGPVGDQPLFGVPMTIKESFDVEGLPTTWGRLDAADRLAPRDADVVASLKAAGAIIIGKTNVPPELADWQADNPVYGRTNNPHDRARVPGGSSGGAAAAVAAGIVPCEYGSDIGGSVRVPAHFCGIFGHKPSWGVVPLQGHTHPSMRHAVHHDGALGVAGPLARSAQDCEALLLATARRPLTRSADPAARKRLLLLLDHPVSQVDDSVRVPIEAAAQALEAAGFTIERTTDTLPDLARQHGDYMRMLNIAMARGLPDASGKRATATDWFTLLDAQEANARAWDALFADYDAVLAPPAPILAFEHRETRIFDGDMRINGSDRPGAEGLAWAGLVTFPGLPATVLPIGETKGLPCGMQVITRRFGDLDALALAARFADILHG